MIAEQPIPSNTDLIGKIRLVEGDLTEQRDVDAIVGLIPASLDVGGSLNQALIRAAGERLDDFILDNIYKPRPGDVFAVPPFALPVRHILFAVTPEWKDGIDREDRDLVRCYRGIMQLATNMKLHRLAFPALGTGKRKYPIRRAARLGVQGIMDRMSPAFGEIRIVCNRRETYDAFQEAIENYRDRYPNRSPTQA